MNAIRRNLMKFSSFGACFAALPFKSAFAEWPNSFETAEYQEALTSVLGDSTPAEGGIAIDAPEIASNGATVPITITTDLANPKSISVLVEKNPRPYVSTFYLNENLEPSVAVRVKMAETSNVVAIVETDSGFHIAKQSVKVTAGGCA